MKRFLLFCLMVTLIIMTMLSLNEQALAQIAQTLDEPVVLVPIKSWITVVGEYITPLLAAAVLWLVRKLPSQIAAILITARVDQLLVNAIKYGINTVKDASPNEPLKVNVGNQVLAKALQFVVDNAPNWLISWMGGIDAIKQKLIARMNIEATGAVTGEKV